MLCEWYANERVTSSERFRERKHYIDKQLVPANAVKLNSWREVVISETLFIYLTFEEKLKSNFLSAHVKNLKSE